MANADTCIMQGRLLTSLLSVYRRALGVDDAQDEDRVAQDVRLECFDPLQEAFMKHLS